MNRDVFFAAIRKSMFGGSFSQSQVDGISDLLDAMDAEPRCADPRFRGYIFATVFHETGQKMVPVREGFATTDAGAIAAVTSLFKSGAISTNYATPDPKTGMSYFGRGRVQNTFLSNYQKLQARFGEPFVLNPDLLLDSQIDAKVTVVGHIEGIWTGKKLSDCFNATVNDPVYARRIVNGTDRATQIAGYYTNAYQAFTSAAAVPAPVVAAKPITLPPVITPSPSPAPSGFWARFFNALFKKAA